MERKEIDTNVVKDRIRTIVSLTNDIKRIMNEYGIILSSSREHSLKNVLLSVYVYFALNLYSNDEVTSAWRDKYFPMDGNGLNMLVDTELNREFTQEQVYENGFLTYKTIQDPYKELRKILDQLPARLEYPWGTVNREIIEAFKDMDAPNSLYAPELEKYKNPIRSYNVLKYRLDNLKKNLDKVCNTINRTKYPDEITGTYKDCMVSTLTNIRDILLKFRPNKPFLDTLSITPLSKGIYTPGDIKNYRMSNNNNELINRGTIFTDISSYTFSNEKIHLPSDGDLGNDHKKILLGDFTPVYTTPQYRYKITGQKTSLTLNSEYYYYGYDYGRQTKKIGQRNVEPTGQYLYSDYNYKIYHPEFKLLSNEYETYTWINDNEVSKFYYGKNIYNISSNREKTITMDSKFSNNLGWKPKIFLYSKPFQEYYNNKDNNKDFFSYGALEAMAVKDTGLNIDRGTLGMTILVPSLVEKYMRYSLRKFTYGNFNDNNPNSYEMRSSPYNTYTRGNEAFFLVGVYPVDNENNIDYKNPILFRPFMGTDLNKDLGGSFVDYQYRIFSEDGEYKLAGKRKFFPLRLGSLFYRNEFSLGITERTFEGVSVGETGEIIVKYKSITDRNEILNNIRNNIKYLMGNTTTDIANIFVSDNRDYINNISSYKDLKITFKNKGYSKIAVQLYYGSTNNFTLNRLYSNVGNLYSYLATDEIWFNGRLNTKNFSSNSVVYSKEYKYKNISKTVTSNLFNKVVSDYRFYLGDDKYKTENIVANKMNNVLGSFIGLPYRKNLDTGRFYYFNTKTNEIDNIDITNKIPDYIKDSIINDNDLANYNEFYKTEPVIIDVLDATTDNAPWLDHKNIPYLYMTVDSNDGHKKYLMNRENDGEYDELEEGLYFKIPDELDQYLLGEYKEDLDVEFNTKEEDFLLYGNIARVKYLRAFTNAIYAVHINNKIIYTAGDNSQFQQNIENNKDGVLLYNWEDSKIPPLRIIERIKEKDILLFLDKRYLVDNGNLSSLSMNGSVDIKFIFKNEFFKSNDPNSPLNYDNIPINGMTVDVRNIAGQSIKIYRAGGFTHPTEYDKLSDYLGIYEKVNYKNYKFKKSETNTKLLKFLHNKGLNPDAFKIDNTRTYYNQNENVDNSFHIQNGAVYDVVSIEMDGLTFKNTFVNKELLVNSMVTDNRRNVIQLPVNVDEDNLSYLKYGLSTQKGKCIINDYSAIKNSSNDEVNLKLLSFDSNLPIYTFKDSTYNMKSEDNKQKPNMNYHNSDIIRSISTVRYLNFFYHFRPLVKIEEKGDDVEVTLESKEDWVARIKKENESFFNKDKLSLHNDDKNILDKFNIYYRVENFNKNTAIIGLSNLYYSSNNSQKEEDIATLDDLFIIAITSTNWTPSIRGDFYNRSDGLGNLYTIFKKIFLSYGEELDININNVGNLSISETSDNKYLIKGYKTIKNLPGGYFLDRFIDDSWAFTYDRNIISEGRNKLREYANETALDLLRCFYLDMLDIRLDYINNLAISKGYKYYLNFSYTTENINRNNIDVSFKHVETFFRNILNILYYTYGRKTKGNGIISDIYGKGLFYSHLGNGMSLYDNEVPLNNKIAKYITEIEGNEERTNKLITEVSSIQEYDNVATTIPNEYNIFRERMNLFLATKKPYFDKYVGEANTHCPFIFSYNVNRVLEHYSTRYRTNSINESYNNYKYMTFDSKEQEFHCVNAYNLYKGDGAISDRTTESFRGFAMSKNNIENPMMGFSMPATTDPNKLPDYIRVVYCDISWKDIDKSNYNSSFDSKTYTPLESSNVTTVTDNSRERMGMTTIINSPTRNYDFREIIDKFNIPKWKEKGVHVVFRLFVDKPGKEDHRDVPNNIPGEVYSNSLGKGFSPDYRDPMVSAGILDFFFAVILFIYINRLDQNGPLSHVMALEYGIGHNNDMYVINNGIRDYSIIKDITIPGKPTLYPALRIFNNNFSDEVLTNGNYGLPDKLKLKKGSITKSLKIMNVFRKALTVNSTTNTANEDYIDNTLAYSYLGSSKRDYDDWFMDNMIFSRDGITDTSNDPIVNIDEANVRSYRPEPNRHKFIYRSGALRNDISMDELVTGNNYRNLLYQMRSLNPLYVIGYIDKEKYPKQYQELLNEMGYKLAISSMSLNMVTMDCVVNLRNDGKNDIPKSLTIGTSFKYKDPNSNELKEVDGSMAVVQLKNGENTIEKNSTLVCNLNLNPVSTYYNYDDKSTSSLYIGLRLEKNTNNTTGSDNNYIHFKLSNVGKDNFICINDFNRLYNFITASDTNHLKYYIDKLAKVKNGYI